MAYIYDLSDAWAASGTTFTAIKLNVTDTASAAGSLLMDLQVGGASRVSVSKGGTILSPLNSASVPALATSAASDRGFGFYQNRPAILYGSTVSLSMPNAGIIGLNSTTTIGWGAGNPIDSTIDTILARDAANTLAQRNGVNAQAFNIYGTYTDASNYERGFMRFGSNRLEIGTAAAGTGVSRDLWLMTAGSQSIFFGIGGGFYRAAVNNDGLNSATFTITDPNSVNSVRGAFRADAAGVIQVSSNRATFVGGALEFLEQTAPAAPATDRVRIYAEDDGAGKTRLMARFATGAAVQIAIEP